MTEAIRVSRPGGWSYEPLAKAQPMIRMAAAGLADADPAGVRLFSDEGPTLQGAAPRPLDPVAALAMVNGRALQLAGSEKLVLGADGSQRAHDEFMDLALVPSHGLHGAPIRQGELEQGELVLTVWPSDMTVMPGRLRRMGRRWYVELPIARPKGDRCFVLDEAGDELVTASLEADGSDSVKAWPSLSVRSWLLAVGAEAMKPAAERFSVEPADGGFLVSDGKTGRRIMAAAKGKRDEESKLRWMLALGGMRSLAASYELRKA